MRLSRLPCAVGTRFFDYWSQCGWSTVSPFEVGLPSQDWTEFPIPRCLFPGLHHIFGDQTDPSLGTCPTWSSTDSKSAVFSITSRAFCGFAQQLRQVSTKIECMTSGVLQRWHIHYRDTTLFVRLPYADYIWLHVPLHVKNYQVVAVHPTTNVATYVDRLNTRLRFLE